MNAMGDFFMERKPVEWENDVVDSLRWCWRHHANVDFYRTDEGRDAMHVCVPLRSPEGDTYDTVHFVDDMANLPCVFREVIRGISARLNLE